MWRIPEVNATHTRIETVAAKRRQEILDWERVSGSLTSAAIEVNFDSA